MRKILSALSLAAVLPACASFRHDVQRVTIEAHPRDAALFVDGEPVGVGVAAVELRRWDSHVVTARLGAREAAVTVASVMNGQGDVAFFGGFLFLPAWLLLADGASYDLEPAHVMVVLSDEEEQQGARP